MENLYLRFWILITHLALGHFPQITWERLWIMNSKESLYRMLMQGRNMNSRDISLTNLTREVNILRLVRLDLSSSRRDLTTHLLTTLLSSLRVQMMKTDYPCLSLKFSKTQIFWNLLEETKVFNNRNQCNNRKQLMTVFCKANY